ncbi:MAG: DUF4129 domain-containing protein, partial [Candidatus Kariarchaeaceae archaeon]
ADIGSHTYTVYFDGHIDVGLDIYRGNGTIEEEVAFDVLDAVDSIIFTSNKATVAPFENYLVSATISTLGGTSPDLLEVRFDETYGNTGNSAFEQHSFNSVTGGVASFTKDYGVSASDTITVSAQVNGWGNYSYLVPLGDPTDITIDVVQQYTFTFGGNISGSAIDASPQYRNNQTLDFYGNLSSFDPNDPSEVSNVQNTPWEIQITGGGYSGGTISGTTNSVGYFTYTMELNISTFPDPTDTPITFQGVIDPLNALTVTVPIKVIPIDLNLQEDIDHITNLSHDVTTDFYFPNSASITVQGILVDRVNANASGVDITLRINNNVFGVPWDGNNGSLAESIVGTDTTNATGGFLINFTVGTYPFVPSRLTLNITADPGIGVWNDPNEVSVEIVDFKYFTSLFNTIEKDLGAGLVAVPNTAANIQTFNDTFATYLQSGAIYNITVRDQFNRIPLGINVTIEGWNTILNYWVNATNNGIFTVSLKTLNDTSIATELLHDGTVITYIIKIADQHASIDEQFEEVYELFGPDEIGPSISTVTVNGANTGIPEDILILVQLDFAASDLNNIENVELHYRYSTNQIDNVTLATFPASFMKVNMTYNIVVPGWYNATISFIEDGRWVQWFFIVHDRAGWGLDVNGDTFDTIGNPFNGTYNLPPGYDNSFSLNATYANRTDVMGDYSIPVLELENQVLINGNLISGDTNRTIDDDIVVHLDLVPDDSGYDVVEIHWRTRVYDPDTGLYTNGSWTSDVMSYFGDVVRDKLYNRYEYTIFSNQTDWFMQFDYFFVINDTSTFPNGNQFTTDSVLEFSGKSLPGAVPLTWVDDDILPEGFQSDDGGWPKDRSLDTSTIFEAWTNETASIQFNVTDLGIGVDSIEIIYYYYDEFGIEDSRESFLLVNDGNITLLQFLKLYQVNATGGYFLVNLSFNFTGLVNGTFVGYEVIVIDKAGNVEIFNDQNDVLTRRFLISDPPEEEQDIPTATTITQDTVITSVINGTTVLITYTSGQVLNAPEEEESSSNALIIIVGFIGGLSLLILYYQRHNIRETLARRARAARVRGSLRELMDEIKRLGAEGKYKRAIMLTWEALERVSREIIQAPRNYNQTAREFAAYLSTITIVDRETLLTLSASYESAKYGKDTPSHDDWDDAVKALDITVRTIIESGARVQLEEDEDEF